VILLAMRNAAKTVSQAVWQQLRKLRVGLLIKKLVIQQCYPLEARIVLCALYVIYPADTH